MLYSLCETAESFMTTFNGGIGGGYFRNGYAEMSDK